MIQPDLHYQQLSQRRVELVVRTRRGRRNMSKSCLRLRLLIARSRLCALCVDPQFAGSDQPPPPLSDPPSQWHELQRDPVQRSLLSSPGPLLLLLQTDHDMELQGIRGNPFGLGLCPATGAVHSDAARSNRESKWPSGAGTQRPSPWRNWYEWYTSGSRRRLLRNPGWPTDSRVGRIPCCWIFWGCIPEESYRRWPDASRTAGCSWDSGQRCCCPTDSRRTLLLRCNTSGLRDLFRLTLVDMAMAREY